MAVVASDLTFIFTFLMVLAWWMVVSHIRLVKIMRLWPLASTTPLYAAVTRERFKHSKYDNIAADEKSPFTPFVMETFGGFGQEALSFLSAPRGAFRTHVIRALSVCLQKGNA